MWKNRIEPAIMEDDSVSYQSRTVKNAQWSDVTLAFAVNPDSQGEIETREAAGSKFLGVKLSGDINDPVFMSDTAEYVVSQIKAREDFPSLNRKGILLNVAGNRLSVLKRNNMDQNSIDKLVEHVLRAVAESGIIIEEIRTGGQSGVDEAGIHAAQSMGRICSILCPKGFRFSDSNGEEHIGYKEFAARFQTASVDGNGQKTFSFLQLMLTVIFTVSLLLSNIIVGKQISLPFGASTVGSVILFPLTYILSDIFFRSIRIQMEPYYLLYGIRDEHCDGPVVRTAAVPALPGLFHRSKFIRSGSGQCSAHHSSIAHSFCDR